MEHSVLLELSPGLLPPHQTSPHSMGPVNTCYSSSLATLLPLLNTFSFFENIWNVHAGNYFGAVHMHYNF